MIEQGKQVDANSVISSPGSNPRTGTTEEQSEVKLVMSLLQQGKQYRSKFDEDWNTRLEYYMGKQWKETTGSKPVLNIIRQIIQATLPIITDQRPGFSVMARDPSDFAFAQVMGTLIENWWDKSSMDHTLIEVLFDSMLYDAGILKITWDNDLEDSLGDVRVERVDPRDIYVPFGAVDFEKNCGWVIQRSQKQVGELKRLFPDMAEEIKSDSSNDIAGSKTSPGMDIKLVSPVDQHTSRTESIGSTSDDRKLCDVIECWIDDESYVEENSEDEQGNQVTVFKKEFPHGKLITILPNQNVVLQSVASPYMHGKKPFVRIVDMILPGEFWGEGEVKALMPQQRMINKTLQHAFDTFQMFSNPVWIIENDSGVDPETITNKISQIIRTAPGKRDSIKRDFPPTVQTGVLDLYNVLLKQAESISGISEITQGRKPTGVTAASAIENIQEASQTRIRMKERNLEVSLQQMGMQIMALMMQFYREPRVVRITNKHDAWPQYFEFFIEEPEQGSYIVNQKNYLFDQNRKQYVPATNYDSSGPTKGTMDVKVMGGTSMPWSKATRTNIAFRLYDLKAIDAKELLETLEWPDAEAVTQRLNEQNQQPEGAPQGMPPQA
jgi:hypothetical protein